MIIPFNRRITVPLNLLKSVFFTVLLGLFLMLEKKGNMLELYRYYCIVALIGYLWIFTVTPKKVNGKINLFLIYIALTIPFYFGGQILVLLGYSDRLFNTTYSILDGRISMEYNVLAMKYIIIAIQCLNIGYQVCNNKKHLSSKDKIVHINRENTRQAISLISGIIIAISLFPTIAKLGYDIVRSVTLGHLAFLQERSEEQYLGIWFIFSYIQGWFLPACYMKIICGGKRGRRFAYTVLLLYSILYLCTGSRYEIIQIGFVLFIIDVYTKERMANKFKFAKYLLVLFIGLIILRSVSYTRDITGSGLSWESIIDVLGGGVLYESLYETSTTFTSISNLFNYCPDFLPFNYGKSVLGSLIYILPSFSRPEIINNIVLHISAELSPLYYGFKGAGYGSSFLTEAYFNYGFFAFLVVIIFGIILRKTTDAISFYVDSQDKRKLIICVFLMSEFLWAIRTDMYLIPRHIIYYIMLPLLLAHFFERRNSID